MSHKCGPGTYRIIWFNSRRSKIEYHLSGLKLLPNELGNRRAEGEDIYEYRGPISDSLRAYITLSGKAVLICYECGEVKAYE